MADYYTCFSLSVPLDSPEEQKWVEDTISKAMESEDWDDHLDFECTIEETELWIYSDMHGNIDHVTDFLQDFLKKFRTPKTYISFEWSNSCSKPRLDAYSGGAAIVFPDRCLYMNTGSWIDDTLKEIGGILVQGTSH